MCEGTFGDDQWWSVKSKARLKRFLESHRVLQALKLNKSSQVISKSSLRKLKDFVISTENAEFSATLLTFLGIKIMSAHNF